MSRRGKPNRGWGVRKGNPLSSWNVAARRYCDVDTSTETEEESL